MVVLVGYFIFVFLLVIMFFIMGYVMGWGLIIWLFMFEVLFLWVCGVVLGFCVLVSWFIVFVFIKFFLLVVVSV